VNAPILRLFGVAVVLFALLVAWTSRWTVFEAEALRDNALNKREVLEQQRVKRGVIRAADGTILARSVPAGAGTWSRRYPTGDLFAHSVGYSFPLTVSQSGLERSRNDELAGERDDIESIIDELAGRDQVGEDLRTSLDPEAQRVALEGLGGQRGAVVALEPRTGRVKVMASFPTFDPNVLRNARNTDALQDGSALNRATLGQYPPGSTFKVVTAVAAIDSGKYTKDSLVDGRSPKTISGAPLSNFSNEQFGAIPLTTALTNSVNTVWAEVGVKLGRETMDEYMRRFGFYERVPVDLPAGERGASGVTVQGRRGFVPVTSDSVDLGRVAIGQGGLLATPLQMAMVASAVANDGELVEPVLTERVVDQDGRTTDRIEPETIEQVMKSETAQQVGDMMADVVSEGTGTAAALSGISVAGKTGTAEIDIANRINTPWFIGFAPRENPKYAVAVAIERAPGGTGGQVAAPIAKRVLETLLQ
jgi:peptidoglycan glycosyltransferase